MIIFSYDFPPQTGGISRLFAEISKQLIIRDKKTKIITLNVEQPKDDLRYDNNITRLTHRRPFREIEALFKLITIPQNTPILCGTWGEGLLAKLAGKKPVIIFTYGGDIGSKRKWWVVWHWKVFKRMVLNSADLVIAISNYTKNLTKQIANKSNVHFIPLGVDALRFKPGDKFVSRKKFELDNNKTIILSISRILEYKGFEVVFKAIAGLSEKERQNIVYIIAGKGPDRKKLQEKTKELGIESQVMWLGFVKEEDLPELYRAADLFALCTREFRGGRGLEGFGLVLLEAQSSGIPVVGARTGGIPDAIKDGEGGFLIEEDDVEGLKNILQELCQNPEEFERQGILARKRVERECTWDHFMSSLLVEFRNNNIGI